MLYEVAILHKPTKEQIENGESEKLLVPPMPVIAQNEKGAIAAVSADAAALLKERNKDRLEILVRPFVK